MADVKWIKIATDIFDNRKIKQIETLPEGDGIIVIWLKLICLAGMVNDGGLIYLTNEIPYTDEMLASQFGRPINLVRLALTTFEGFGMIEIINDMILLSSWEKYQSADRLERIREQNRLRKQRERERKQLPAEAKNMSRNVTQNVTHCHATDIDKDKDIDIDNIYTPVVDFLNERAGTKYRASSRKTQSLIKARVNDGFGLDDFKRVIGNKCSEWMGTDMEQYLRPETLFGTKFESYLNSKTGKGRQRQCNAAENDLDGIL